MNKICILGATGLLGHAVNTLFSDRFANQEIITPTRSELDVTNFSALKSFLIKLNPDVVVNCVGYTAVDLPETDPKAKALCQKLNTELVEALIEITNTMHAKLVHFSTDYVFSGDNANGYDENAIPGVPLNFYGETKKQAEELILKSCNDYFLIRTSWLFGPSKGNFVTTMLDLATKLPELKVVNDQHGKPTFTLDIASRLADMLTQNAQTGVYHLVNEGDTTWFEFAKNIFTLFNKEVKVVAATSQEFARPARRPMYSSLVCTKLPKMRNHLEALAEYKNILNS